MGYASTAKKEDVLESLVGGGCVNCASGKILVNEFLENNTMYTSVKCQLCRHEEIFQAQPEHHMNGKHVF